MTMIINITPPWVCTSQTVAGSCTQAINIRYIYNTSMHPVCGSEDCYGSKSVKHQFPHTMPFESLRPFSSVLAVLGMLQSKGHDLISSNGCLMSITIDLCTLPEATTTMYYHDNTTLGKSPYCDNMTAKIPSNNLRQG